jgi:aspartyl-tRNA(Asn)/glutamyl-tRNA(Gln) amidotransferase subunit C
MDIEDLKETAALAHLNLDEAELAASFPAFEQMLGFFAAMQAADEDRAVLPFFASSHSDAAGAHVRTVISDHFRPDAAHGGVVQSTSIHSPAEGLLDNAGERDGRFIVVPNVL